MLGIFFWLERVEVAFGPKDNNPIEVTPIVERGGQFSHKNLPPHYIEHALRFPPVGGLKMAGRELERK